MRHLTDGDFNPRAPCGARREGAEVYERFNIISIHAPLAGRDLVWSHWKEFNGISIHAPLAGRDRWIPGRS